MLLCGRSFSGKSTLTRALAEALPAVMVSVDAINDERGLHGGDGIPIEERAATMDIAHQRVGAALRDSATVVVDDTSLPRSLRDAWRELGASCDAPVVLVFIDAAPTTVLAQQAGNRKTPVRRDRDRGRGRGRARDGLFRADRGHQRSTVQLGHDLATPQPRHAHCPPRGGPLLGVVPCSGQLGGNPSLSTWRATRRVGR